MRKIIFNEEFIQQLRTYMEEGHTIKEACNRFTLKNDTLRRLLFEYNIRPNSRYDDWNRKKCIFVYKDIPQELINAVCNLYQNTNSTIHQICREVKLNNYQVQIILNNNFTQEYRDTRKSKLYSISKLGDKNPMTGKFGKAHPNYKGLCEDGMGYLTILKPDWYTGRKNYPRIYYHHYVICKSLGITEIPKGYCVHHIDHNPLNNDISNLVLLSISAHSRLHQIENKMQGAETIHKGVGDKSETPNINR